MQFGAFIERLSRSNTIPGWKNFLGTIGRVPKMLGRSPPFWIELFQITHAARR